MAGKRRDREGEALAEAAAAAVERIYAELWTSLPEPTAAIAFGVYFDGDSATQFFAAAFAAPTLADLDDYATGPELPYPDADPGPECEALLEHINERDAYDLVDVYYASLCRRLTKRLGIPVVAESPDSGLGAFDGELQWPEPWREEALLMDGEAGIHRARGGHLLITYGAPHGGTVVERPIHELHGDPAAVGGVLPEGAVAVEVTDLFGVVHRAKTAEGLWLCALPHRARGGTPPIRFLDRRGDEIAIARREPQEHAISFSVPGGEFDAAEAPGRPGGS
jgi:hypothetical protein